MENPINQQVGERIAAVRNQMGMTQADLAANMSAFLGREIRPLTVTRLEGGKRPIGVDELTAAASAMRVKPADLLSDSDLPMVAVAALSAGQSFARATNELTDAIGRWQDCQKQLRRALGWTTQVQRLSDSSLMWLTTASQLELDAVIKGAIELAERTGADGSDA